MQRYMVEDMSCEHCVGTVTKAIKTSGPEATVNIDLASKTVAADSAVSNDDIRDAIRSADYEPQPAA